MTNDPFIPPPVTPAEPGPPRTASVPSAPATGTAPDAAGPSADVAFTGRTSGPSRLRVGVVSAAAVALAIGAIGTSLAASPAPETSDTGTGATGTSAWAAPATVSGLGDELAGAFEHGRFGGHGGVRDITISAIDGATLHLETSDGWTRAVTVSDSVELTRGGQPIELADVAVGDEIRLLQEVSDDGTVTVIGIEVVVPSVAGEVTDLTATGFKVTARGGAVWTVTLTGDTVYSYGAGDGTLADIANGDIVHVQGTSSGDNALTATSVAVRGDLAMGTVTATTADSITIEDRAGDSVTIHVDADTIYRSPGADDASLADIAVDEVIAVSGRARSDGSIDADVVIEGRHPDGPGFRGDRGGHGGRGGTPSFLRDKDDVSTHAG